MLDEPLLEQIKIFSQDIGYVSISSVQRKFMLSYKFHHPTKHVII